MNSHYSAADLLADQKMEEEQRQDRWAERLGNAVDALVQSYMEIGLTPLSAEAALLECAYRARPDKLESNL